MNKKQKPIVVPDIKTLRYNSDMACEKILNNFFDLVIKDIASKIEERSKQGYYDAFGVYYELDVECNIKVGNFDKKKVKTVLEKIRNYFWYIGFKTRVYYFTDRLYTSRVVVKISWK